MVTLQTSKGFQFQIDDEDKDLVQQFKWYRHKHGNTSYIMTLVSDNGTNRSMYLHRLLLNAEKNFVVRHKDGNGWNNTRENLETTTRAQLPKPRRQPRVRAKINEVKPKKMIVATCGACNRQFAIQKHLATFKKRHNVSGKIFCSRLCGSKMSRGARNKIVDNGSYGAAT
jgi:hypothetical protein